ncbi:hypothetical protein DRN97_00065 [Methanosarcinales archaeon]|nr:MAG: hypothetical protein DRN97_00065 [Methanosarcinales archaeon]
MYALVIAPYEGTKVLEAASILAHVCIEALEAEAFEVDSLEGEKATRGNLPKDKKYDLILFSGHGEERRLVGSDGRAIFNDNNIDYVSGSIFIAIACESGNWLALSAASKGAKAYFGFRNLALLPQSSEKHAYLSDFVRTLSVPLLSLLEGYTIHQAWEAFQGLCREYAIEYETNKYDNFAEVMAAWMRYNANSAVYQGAPNATLGEEVFVIRRES